VATWELGLVNRKLGANFGIAVSAASVGSPFRCQALHLIADAGVLLTFRWVAKVKVAGCVLKANFPGELVVLGELVGKWLRGAIDDWE